MTCANGLLAAIPYPHLDPVVFQIGRHLAVRWYGIAYLAGFLLAYWVLLRLASSGAFRVSRPLVADLVSWLAMGVLLGGRLGWWIFYHYHRNEGQPEPWYEPFAIWHGGMSFHGGLVGVTLAMFIWCKWRAASMLNVADCAALVTPIGLFFGRLANFINAELVGRPTAVAWGMIFPGDTVPRHPSQLYEAFLEGPLLLALLWLVFRLRRPRDGGIAGLFMIGYGLLRFGVEFTREPDAQLGFIAFGWLTMGQLLSLALALAGAVFWWASQRRSA